MALFNVSEVRDYINVSLLNGDLQYTMPFSIRVRYCNEKTNGWVETSSNLIKKNKQESRPRLFDTNDKPIELAHCDEALLCEEFNKLKKYLREEHEKSKVNECLAEIKNYFGRDFKKEYQDAGLDISVLNLSEEKFVVELTGGNEEFYNNLSLDKLSDIVSDIKGASNILTIYNKFKTVKPSNAEEKADYYRCLSIVSPDKDKVYATLESLWREAAELQVEVPVIDGYIYRKEVIEDVTAILREQGYNEIYACNHSSGLMETLLIMAKLGWNHIETKVVEYTDKWAFRKDRQVRTTEVLAISYKDLN